MRNAAVLLALSALALIPAAARADSDAAPRHRVLVELFTSQG